MKPQRPHKNPSPEEDIAQDSELWDLLGKADKPTPVSPFFARNVMREIRLADAQKAEETASGGLLQGLLRRWRMVMTGTAMAGAVALVATLAILAPQYDPSGTASATAVVTTAAYDAEIIAQLDELLDDDSIWLDSTVSAY